MRMTKEEFQALRQKYMTNEMTHQEYYIGLAKIMGLNGVAMIPNEQIKASTDESFNDIPLKKWDDHHGLVSHLAYQHFPVWSLSDTVCVLKAIAREIRGH